MLNSLILRLTTKFIGQGLSLIDARNKAIKRYNYLLECGRLDSRANTQVKGL